MNAHLRLTLTTMCLIMAATSIAPAQPPDSGTPHPPDLTGEWKITIASPEKEEQSVILRLLQERDSVFAIDRESNARIPLGMKNGNRVMLLLMGDDGPYTLWGYANEKTMLGEVVSGSYDNPPTFDSAATAWMATFLAQIWMCSNHAPRHAATSTRERQRLTRQEGCKGWKLDNGK